jgi:lysophospholipase L1-like esterase
MMKRILLSLSVIIFLLCCKKPESARFTAAPGTTEPVIVETNPQEHSDTAGIKTYLALGDSYTFGQSVADNQRMPVQVSTQLTGLGIKVSAPEIIARTGWTTGNLLDKLNAEPPRFNDYNIVTLLIGVNNQYQGRSQDEYREQFTTLVTKAIEYAGNNSNRVFVLSIPDWSVTPFAGGSNRDLISKQIDSFNVINKQISLQKKVHYTDITDLSRLAATDPSLIASDGLHPSGDQYRMWVNRLAPTIRVIFY